MRTTGNRMGILRATRFVLALLLTSSAGAAAALDADPIPRSVVKVHVTQRGPSPLRPWAKNEARESSGSGFIIEGKRIITNAHVVQYASQIYVQASGSSERLAAKVLFAAPPIDLAILTVDNDAFFADHPALEVEAAIVREKTAVNVYGFPMGGDQLSITEGIVSRVDYSPYFYDEMGVRIQIDAALNPGNSGGPAIAGGKVVGIAFSGMNRATGADNIGYLIATEELLTMLRDFEDGKYEGKPKLWHEVQTTENDTLRSWLKLSADVGGAMITRCGDDTGVLQVGDVITHVGPHPVERDGYVRLSGELPFVYQYYVEKLAQDGTVPLKIVRDGVTLEVAAPVASRRQRLIPYLENTYPEYFIIGPLVFSAPCQELVYSRESAQWIAALIIMGSPLISRMSDGPAFEGEQLVYVPSPFLPHAVTKGYSPPTLRVLKAVNHEPVRNLKHLVELLRDTQDEYLEFEFTGRSTERLVFRRAELLGVTEEILSDAGIRNQYSESLREVWEPKEAAN